ncbi:MAG: hypothetical protein QM802_16030 [Agriterribacter sp.]
MYIFSPPTLAGKFEYGKQGEKFSEYASMVVDVWREIILSSTYKCKKMKAFKKKQLLRGLKNIQSKYYCKFSEKEHLILSHAIKRLSKQKPNWIKNGKKALKQIVSFIVKLF